MRAMIKNCHSEETSSWVGQGESCHGQWCLAWAQQILESSDFYLTWGVDQVLPRRLLHLCEFAISVRLLECWTPHPPKTGSLYLWMRPQKLALFFQSVTVEWGLGWSLQVRNLLWQQDLFKEETDCQASIFM